MKNDGSYERLRSTGGQPARLYGIAKVPKKDTALGAALSLPGSSYGKMFLIQRYIITEYFDKTEVASFETNTKAARDMIENTNLDSEQNINSLDVKNLYTNVPLKEVIDITHKKLYNQSGSPDLSRSTMKRLLYMAVRNVHFKCNDIWY